MEAGHPALLAELLVSGRQPGDGDDQPAKSDGPEARARADHQGHDHQSES
jgi:hypothetical protein